MRYIICMVIKRQTIQGAARAIAVRVGSKWAAVVDHGQAGATGTRQGCWCEDAAGGWGVSRSDPERAVKECARPSLYPSRKAAYESVDPLGEMEHSFIEPMSAAAALGARGGAAGTGESKRRGTDHYREMAKRSAAKRRKR